MLMTREAPEIGIAQKTQDVYFRLTSTKYFDEFGKKKVYGIEVRYGDITERIEDISSRKDIVINLIQKLETEKCSLIHFRDVVEDFIIDQII